MDMILLYIFLSVLYTECIAGLIINLIIVAANIVKWRKMKSLPIRDKILSCLATSRCLYLFRVVMGFVWSALDLWDIINVQAFSAVSMISSMFLHFTNLWLATVLCVFYCVKITSYSWKFFIFLKTKISTLVPWFLMASLMISVSFSLLFSLRSLEKPEQNRNNISTETDYDNEFMFLLAGSCPPFLVFLVADFLLLHSLWMHTMRMRSSGSGFRSPNLESHFSAVKSMSFFLVLQTMYFVITVYAYSAVYWEVTSFYIISIVIYSPPTLHSLYIISTNSDIKKTCVSMFHVLTCCAKG